jgi:hypothetical protein
MSTTKSTTLGRIVRAAIHPAIGIARVGNSKEEYYIGPEVAEPASKPPGFYKDASGALKREAACFRIYGYDADGNVVAELNAANAEITWTAHLANEKAAWYQFQIALDIPEANQPPPALDPSLRRNGSFFGTNRQNLVIEPGAIAIQGVNQSGSSYQFDGGQFCGKSVYLGELRTDAAGRLLVLGGHGVSASFDGKPAVTFANNDGWHDDVADGPVTASVIIDGQSIPCDGAWVAVAPPNYAPDLVSVRTMYDLLLALFVDAEWLPAPATVSFTNDILPILQRLSNLGWVNSGFATGFGWDAPLYFGDPALLKKLSQQPTKAADGSVADEFGELRRQIDNAFRVYDRDGMSPVPWPWIYGDAMSIPATSPRQYSTLSSLQMSLLGRWEKGDFVDDYGSTPPPPRTLDEVELAQQPAMLDRAALTFCLADAFHPGCEITWPIRHLSMFTAPFRIRHRAPGETEPDYGPQLTPAIALSPSGPLYAQGPGGLTRWMAVPWQTDTASCQSGYDATYDPLMPTFWAARVPNQVLTQADYQIVTDPNLPPAQRLSAFNNRSKWMRVLDKSYKIYINQMVSDFGEMGVVETHVNATDPLLPPLILVESEPGAIVASPTNVKKFALAAAASEPDSERHEAPADKIHRFR